MRGAAEGTFRAGGGRDSRGGQLLRQVAFESDDEEALRLVELVARARGVPTLLLLHRSRCAAEVAKARQLAMYLMHVILRRTYAEVGGFFGRDRTTVSHACARIEDQRDSWRFESEVAELEVALGDFVTVRPGNGAGHAPR